VESFCLSQILKVGETKLEEKRIYGRKKEQKRNNRGGRETVFGKHNGVVYVSVQTTHIFTASIVIIVVFVTDVRPVKRLCCQQLLILQTTTAVNITVIIIIIIIIAVMN